MKQKAKPFTGEFPKSRLIAFPTETVYGLGASIYDPVAINQIFELKGRPRDNPLIVHVADVETMGQLAKLPQKLQLLEALWPGPLTVVLEAKDVPPEVTGQLPTVALRIPDHELALQLLRERGPMVAPSANLSGKPSPTEASHVLHDFDVPIIDGGLCRIGLESTILSLVDKPTILRPGAIAKETLEELLGEEVLLSQSKEALAPGMKYRHYAPEAKLVLVEDEAELIEAQGRIIQKGIAPENLYKFLRECDLKGFSEIFLLVTEKMRTHPALMNRLEKAAMVK